MATAAGFEWIIEAGIGDSFARPRITWHSLPGDLGLARRMFSAPSVRQTSPRAQTPFFEELQRTPGQCGLLTFESVRASAPSLGLVAAALAGGEMLRVTGGIREVVEGSATLWIPLLPYSREAVTLAGETCGTSDGSA